jgi:hypothetical protein
MSREGIATAQPRAKLPRAVMAMTCVESSNVCNAVQAISRRTLREIAALRHQRHWVARLGWTACQLHQPTRSESVHALG